MDTPHHVIGPALGMLAFGRGHVIGEGGEQTHFVAGIAQCGDQDAHRQCGKRGEIVEIDKKSTMPGLATGLNRRYWPGPQGCACGGAGGLDWPSFILREIHSHPVYPQSPSRGGEI